MGFAIRGSSVSGLRVNDSATADDRDRLGQERILTQRRALVNIDVARRYERLGASVFSGCTKRNWLDADSARSTGIMGPQAVRVPEDRINALAFWFANVPCAVKQ